MKKILVFTVLFLSLYSGYGQHSVNNYKYVIVPDRFEFLKVPNEYRLNELTKFLFKKYSFTTLMESDPLPDEVLSNGCLALNANVLDDSGLFKTSLSIQLKNCKGDIVYTTMQGNSREKDRAVAYNKALRGAFLSFETLNYSYKPDANQIKAQTETTKAQEQINTLKKEIETLKENKKVEEVPKKNQATVHLIKEALPLQKTNQIQKTNQTAGDSELYAQEIPNGYQVVDSTPKVVFTLWQSNLQDVFIVKDKNAIVYKEDDFWIYSSVKNRETVSKVLPIHFK